jgi:hypothetical protein
MSPESPSGVPRKPRRGLAIAGLAGLLVVVLVVASGLWNRNASEAKLKEWTDTQSVPVVSIVQPANSANQSSLDLPGRLEAYTRAPIYARVGGFLKARSRRPISTSSSCKPRQRSPARRRPRHWRR